MAKAEEAQAIGLVDEISSQAGRVIATEYEIMNGTQHPDAVKNGLKKRHQSARPQSSAEPACQDDPRRKIRSRADCSHDSRSADCRCTGSIRNFAQNIIKAAA